MVDTLEITDEDDVVTAKPVENILVAVHENGFSDHADVDESFEQRVVCRTTMQETIERESTSLDRQTRSSRTNKLMPSARTQSEEKLDGVSLPYGSEKVLSVKRRSKHGTAKTRPLSINIGDTRTISTSEGDLTMRRTMRREKRHYAGVYEDPKTHRMSLYSSHRRLGDSRKSNVHSSILYEPNSDRRRVISCLELDLAEPDSETITVEPLRNGDKMTPTSVPVFTDPRVNQGTFVFPRDTSKFKTSKEREIYVPIRVEDNEQQGIRYSGVFAPELVKSRTGSRHRLHKSRSSHFYPSPSTPIWSPFVPVPMNLCSNCMTPTCQRCHTSVSSPRKSYSQDVLSATPYPYEPVDVRGSQYFDMPPMTPHQHYYRHQHNQYQQQARQRMSNYYSGSRVSDIDRIAYVPPRSNLVNTSIEETNGNYGFENDRMVDLLEIEYASINDESSATQLSPKRLNLIVTLAREAVGSTDELESMAKHLKLALDQQLGEKWHVVIGIDSFGSNLASLPGALVNFKVDKYVFLVWQT